MNILGVLQAVRALKQERPSSWLKPRRFSGTATHKHGIFAPRAGKDAFLDATKRVGTGTIDECMSMAAPKLRKESSMRFTLRTLLVVSLAGLLASTYALRAAGSKTETVQIPTGKEMIGGYLATPEKPGRYPGIVVIHEWWGLNDWVKQETEKLAAEGFVALAVDLYRGKVATDMSEAHELMRGVPEDRALRDMMAAYDYLTPRKDVDRDRIASVGWCMGGGYSLQLAIHQPRLAACVVNYGALPTDPNDLQQIFAPVLGK